MTRPIILSWSGGKDAAMTLARLRDDPHWRVVALLTTVTRGYERIAMHGVRRTLLHLQAERLGLPLIESVIEPGADNAQYEQAFANALAQSRAADTEVADIAFGDLFLADVRAYREALLTRLGWNGVYPLWCGDTARLARRFITDGWRAILCCVDTQQLDADFCGRDYDADLLDALPPSCDPCGENGEFHTFVHAGPLFGTPIAVARGDRVRRDGRFEYIDLVPA